MNGKKVAGLLITLVALGGIGYFGYTFLFKKKDDSGKSDDKNTNDETNTDNHNPVKPDLPAHTTPSVVEPAPPIPIVVNSLVNALRTTGQYIGSGLVTKYTAGGTDGHGNIAARNYAGQVLEINKTFHSAKLLAYNTAPKNGNTPVREFWVNINDLVAIKPL